MIFLGCHTKSSGYKRKNKSMGLHHTKKLLHSKENNKKKEERKKMQATDWKKIFANHTSDNG